MTKTIEPGGGLSGGVFSLSPAAPRLPLKWLSPWASPPAPVETLGRVYSCPSDHPLTSPWR